MAVNHRKETLHHPIRKMILSREGPCWGQREYRIGNERKDHMTAFRNKDWNHYEYSFLILISICLHTYWPNIFCFYPFSYPYLLTSDVFIRLNFVSQDLRYKLLNSGCDSGSNRRNFLPALTTFNSARLDVFLPNGEILSTWDPVMTHWNGSQERLPVSHFGLLLTNRHEGGFCAGWSDGI